MKFPDQSSHSNMITCLRIFLPLIFTFSCSGAWSETSHIPMNCSGPLARPNVQALGNETIERIRKNQTRFDSEGHLFAEFNLMLIEASARSRSGEEMTTCFPALRTLFGEIEAKRAADRRQAETLRREEQRKLEEKRMAATTVEESEKPRALLAKAYFAYIVLRRCAEDPRVFVTEEAMMNARHAVQEVQKKLVQLEPKLETDAVWLEANQVANKLSLNVLLLCGDSSQTLQSMYKKLIPESEILKKDF